MSRKLIIKELNFSYSKRHLFDMLDLLVDSYNWEFIDKTTLFDKNNKLENISHLLLISGSSEIDNFRLPKETKISYIIDDLHTCGNIKQKRSTNYKKVYKIFATYGYCLNIFYPMIPDDKVLWFPHSARYKIDFNNNPIKKILISGRITMSQYPNRYLIYKMIKKNKFIYYDKPKLNGYRAKTDEDKNNKIYGEKYYKLLNEYIISFTCDLNENRPYIVAKHFEILASGSLLLACNPHTKNEFESLGFIDNVDYISCNSENLEEKISWLKDDNNLNKINEIRKNGYDKVNLKHTWINRTQLLNEILT